MADYVKNGIMYAEGMLIGPNEDYAIVFDVDGTLKIVSDPFRSTQTIAVTYSTTGGVTASGGFAFPATSLATASRALVAADSGKLLVAVVDGAYTLPLAAAVPGAQFTVMTGVASAGTGVTITRAGADVINAKTTSAGTVAITGATTVTNTGATDVVWDYMTLRSDGVAGWYSVGQTGVWA